MVTRHRATGSVDARIGNTDRGSGAIRLNRAGGPGPIALVARELHRTGTPIGPGVVAAKEPHRAQRRGVPSVADGHADRNVGVAVGILVVEGTGVTRVAAREGGEIPVPGRLQLDHGDASVDAKERQVFLPGFIVGAVRIVYAVGRCVRHGRQAPGGDRNQHDADPQKARCALRARFSCRFHAVLPNPCDSLTPGEMHTLAPRPPLGPCLVRPARTAVRTHCRPSLTPIDRSFLSHSFPRATHHPRPTRATLRLLAARSRALGKSTTVLLRWTL